MKRLLRDKANFEVLEGFLSTLLEKEIHIVNILESESNQEHPEAKYNRVDLVAETTDGEKMLIEVQNQSEIAYFHRILFGTSRLISDYTRLGDEYGKISKIYSVNIVYFRLGEGDDSVYVGKTEFRGLHDCSVLRLPKRWQEKLHVEDVADIFPTYYILRVNDFDRWSRTPLDQWLYFLSKGRLGDEPTAPGLKAVREKLRLESLSEGERRAYFSKLDDQLSIIHGYNDALEEGLEKGLQQGLQRGIQQGFEQGHERGLEQGLQQGLQQGREQGLQQGRDEGRDERSAEIARNMLAMGLPAATVSAATGLTLEEVEAL